MKTLAVVLENYGPWGYGSSFESIRGKNACVLSYQDNGLCGPHEIAPEDPALPGFVVASAHDGAEAYIWDPVTGEWSPVTPPSRESQKLLPKLRWRWRWRK